MVGHRNRAKVEEGDVLKPLTVVERLSLLETSEVLLKYPIGLLQPFSRQELNRLKKQFVQLIAVEDTSRDLRVTLQVLLQMSELRTQPFAPLVARLILDRQKSAATSLKDGNNDSDLVSFSGFVTTLAVFSVKQSLELKRQVLFNVYDRECKGYVTLGDFLRVISTVSRSNLAQLKSLRQSLEMHLAPHLTQTISGGNGVLLSNFNQLIPDEEVDAAMTIVY